MSSSCVECSHGGERAQGLCEEESNTLPVLIDPARPDIVPWNRMDGWMDGRTNLNSFFFSKILLKKIAIEESDYMVELRPSFRGMFDLWGHPRLTCGRQWMSSWQGWKCERRKHLYFLFHFIFHFLKAFISRCSKGSYWWEASTPLEVKDILYLCKAASSKLEPSLIHWRQPCHRIHSNLEVSLFTTHSFRANCSHIL